MTRVDRDREARRQRERGDYARNHHLRIRYGITLEEFERIKIAQNHRCAVCQRHESELPRERQRGRPRLDGSANAPAATLEPHDRNGRYDTLLCHRCLVGLRRFESDPQRLLAAAAYLERATSGVVRLAPVPC